MTTTVTIIVTAVLVLIVAGFLATLALRKRRAQRGSRASAVRREVVTSHQHRVEEKRGEARARQAEAERKQAEAETAQLEAERAASALAQEQAALEDRVREADRLDPDVKHRAKDYAPDTSTPARESAAEDDAPRP